MRVERGMTRRWRLIPRVSMVIVTTTRPVAVLERTATGRVTRVPAPSDRRRPGRNRGHWRIRSRIQTPASFRTPVPAHVLPLQVPVLKTAPERWSSE